MIFPPGVTTVNFQIDIFNDVDDEDDEEFGLQLQNPLVGTVSPTLQSATCVIIDADGKLSFGRNM